jgi:steroid delta-isomerase-like uncharacterized protein
MTEIENEKVVREIVNTINCQDLDALLDYLADDVTAYLSGFDEIVGKEGVRMSWVEWYTAFPDIVFRVDRMLSQNNTVVVESTGTGTHKGEILGIPETNKKFEAVGIWIFDFENGKVKLWKEYYNIPGFAGTQLKQYLLE